jgi:putative hydrolase of the HAD superfamily
MIKAILFDLDNTLIDFWTFKNKCVDAALKAMLKAGLKISKTKAEKIVSELFKKHGMEYEYVFQDLIKKVYGKLDYRMLAHALNAYRKERVRMLVPYPHVRQVFKELKGNYKIAILSDAPRQKAWLRIVLIGIDDLIDEIITFEDTKQKKPNKAPFKKAIEKLKLKPEEVLMVGDSISKDMEGAKKVGMKTALALYGRTLKPKIKPESVDFMIRQIDELPRILKNSRI